MRNLKNHAVLMRNAIDSYLSRASPVRQRKPNVEPVARSSTNRGDRSSAYRKAICGPHHPRLCNIIFLFRQQSAALPRSGFRAGAYRRTVADSILGRTGRAKQCGYSRARTPPPRVGPAAVLVNRISNAGALAWDWAVTFETFSSHPNTQTIQTSGRVASRRLQSPQRLDLR